MIRRHPSSTLFPSPPLSGSQRERHCETVGHADDNVPDDRARGEVVLDVRCQRHGASPAYRPALSSSRLTDRKSTRLNSSHGYISYAVFCLKKKKKTLTRADNLSLLSDSQTTRHLPADPQSSHPISY